MSKFVFFLARNDIYGADLFAIQGLLLPDARSSSTVQDFISDSLDLEQGRFSDIAVRAMAALLFERTTQVATKWKPSVFHSE